MKRKSFVVILGVLTTASALCLSTSAHAQSYIPLEPIPGFETAADFPSYLSAIYRFALWAVGIAAMFMLTIGGGMYLTSAGNTSATGNAKGVIADAIIGLVLALTAWFLLNFINPQIINGDLSTFSTMSITSGATTVADTVGAEVTGASTNPTGSTACANCTAIPSSVPNKGCSPPASGYDAQPCRLDSALLAKIQNINATGWRITESYPPTVTHLSSCHRNGTCADLNNSGGSTDPTTIKAYYDAFQAAGLNVLYESKNCAPYIAAGVTNCKSYSTMTYTSSFHVS
ncbi:MAG TPA: pilin [Candidatus Fimivivens sp.]|nr:pilin [Candidatus Fimivivens sp.]